MHLLFAVLLAVHWLVASDLHVEPGPGSAAPTQYKEDTNWALFDSAVAAMRRADANPQVVILGGDFLAHRFPHDVPLARATMARIVRTFDKAFPHAQFVIVPGNNDDPCGDYRDAPGDPYFKSIARLWAPLVNRHGAAPQFEQQFGEYGWYTARLPVANMRAIALDTVYWSTFYRRCGNYQPRAAQRELRWFGSALDGLPPSSRAMIVMHIPPGIDPLSTMIAHRFLVVPYWQEQRASAFVRDLRTHASRIAFALAGHAHRDGFRLFGGVPIVVAPSISPIYKNNPAFLRLDVAPDGTLHDYTQFYFDYSANDWQAADSFDRTFGVREISAQTLASLHERLRYDAQLRRKWSEMFVAQSMYLNIDADTWRTFWCAQTELAGTYTACAGLQRRIEVLPVAAGVVVAGVVALLAFLAVRLGRRRRRT